MNQPTYGCLRHFAFFSNDWEIKQFFHDLNSFLSSWGQIVKPGNEFTENETYEYGSYNFLCIFKKPINPIE